MNTLHISTVVAAAALVALAQASFAHSAAPASPADVSAQHQAVVVAYALIPAGQGDLGDAASQRSTSSLTRAQVAAATREAARTDDLAPAGEHVDEVVQDGYPNRVDAPRNAANRAARGGVMTPAGEGPTAPKK